MAESYFELLTEQQGLPAKSFNPLEELRLLRRKLDVRLQPLEPPEKVPADTPPLPEKIEVSEVSLPLPSESPHGETEPVSLAAVVDKVENIQKTLTLGQPFQEYDGQENFGQVQPAPLAQPAPLLNNIIQGGGKPESRKPVSAQVSQYLDVPQGGGWETLNVGLTALGVIGAVFGILTFLRGWDGDLPLSTWVCASGMAIIVLGLGGRFLASHSDTPTQA